MRIQLLRDVTIPDGQFPSGMVIVTSEEITARLIERGHAVPFVEEEHVAPPAPAIEKAVMSATSEKAVIKTAKTPLKPKLTA